MESEKLFRFLEEKHGYSYLSGVVDYRNNYKVIVPFNNHSVDGPFIAVTRYEQDGRAIEIVYGHDNYSLEIFVYTDVVTRLDLHDLVVAMRKDIEFDVSSVWLSDVSRVKDMLARFAEVLQEHAARLLPPSEKLVDRALSIRSKLLEQAIRAHYQKALEAASVKAAQAFMQKEYKIVIETLRPFADDLSAADLKKLRRAHKIFLGLAV